jgi:hypothetical protein
MSGHGESPWQRPAGVAGAFIHRMMINLSLPAARAAVKYSSINEIGPEPSGRPGLLRRVCSA